MRTQSNSYTQVNGSIAIGLIMGAVIGVIYSFYQGIPLQKPVWWWAISIGTLKFAYAVWTIPGWNVWRIIVFFLAPCLSGVELYYNPSLFELMRSGDQAVYDHIWLGQGIGAICGILSAFMFPVVPWMR